MGTIIWLIIAIGLSIGMILTRPVAKKHAGKMGLLKSDRRVNKLKDLWRMEEENNEMS